MKLDAYIYIFFYVQKFVMNIKVIKLMVRIYSYSIYKWFI
jgi:hypothetical protein